MSEASMRPLPPVRGKVNVRHYGNLLPDQDMSLWPSVTEDGYDFLGMLAKEGVTPEPCGSTGGKMDASFWQAAVRWALLKKYGCLEQQNSNLKDPFVVVPNENHKAKVRTLHFSNDDLATITKLWNEQCDLATTESKINGNDKNDLHQFLRTGGLSNHRRMQWSFLDCGPACQFQLHAHPNLEVIYCVSGELHEIRLEGPPPTKTFQKVTTDDNNDGTKLKGPDLSQLARPWKFYTLRQGDFLVNEVGSIHKSFSATNGNGCQLLVCWGGSHADVTHDMEPKSVSVQGAVDVMDARITSCGCHDEPLSEIFLPDSERSDATK